MVPMFYNLTGLYRAQGDVSQAIATLREGIAIEEVSLDISLANLGNSDRIAQVAKLANTLNYVVSLHLDTAPNSTPAAQFALTNLLRRKGRVLEAGVRAQEILRQRGTPEDLDLLAQLMAGQQELANLTTQRPANLSDREYQTRLTRLRSEVNQVEAAIARQSADLSLAGQPVELPAIQQQIPDHGVLIEFIRYRPFDPTQPLGDRFNEANLTAAGSNNFSAPRYAAYLLFPDGRIVARDLGDAATIEAAVQDFVGILQNPATDLSATASSDAVAEITQNIATLVFGAIAPDLAAVEHLLISPDGQLNLLPFEALQTEAGGDYLVQQYQISYLNSGRDLLKFDAVEPSQNPALILADPDYETAANLPSSDVAAGSGTRADSRAADFRQLQFTRLPGTAAEAEAIRPFLPNARVLTTDQATENAVKQVQAPRILHIATHGFFLTDVEPPALAGRGIGVVASDGTLPSTTLPRASVDVENPLLRSGLALAGFNRRRSGSEDGVFTALEASSLNLLGTQLVVLSACDTGLGDITNGEGVYGLRRAFAIAGAESQLMSLWQVSDFGTQSLMAQYYEKLAAGMGRSAALRAVQLEMLASGGEYSHPYYWAAFILAGDWRSL
jgi:CHAT domain-containing protein